MGDKANEEPKPLPAGKVGMIEKVFREFQLEDDCWKWVETEPGTNCEIWEATCDKSQVDIYTGNFTTPQIHQYKKGGHIKVCCSKILLPKTNRIF